MLERPPVASSAGSDSVTGRGLLKTKRGIQRRMTVYLPVDLAQALKVHCAQEDCGISEIMTTAVARYLEQAG